MSNHPLNLALRFLLELIALGAMAYWGWTQHNGVWRWIAALGLPLIAAVLWISFRVPGDMERMVQSFQGSNGVLGEAFRAPAQPRDGRVAVPGVVRLAIEALFFGGAVWLLALAGQLRPALIFGIIVVLHYAASYDRIRWLLSRT